MWQTPLPSRSSPLQRLLSIGQAVSGHFRPGPRLQQSQSTDRFRSPVSVRLAWPRVRVGLGGLRRPALLDTRGVPELKSVGPLFVLPCFSFRCFMTIKFMSSERICNIIAEFIFGIDPTKT
jgi:hypothetical protein